LFFGSGDTQEWAKVKPKSNEDTNEEEIKLNLE
jgi:hypothetical protein